MAFHVMRTSDGALWYTSFDSKKMRSVAVAGVSGIFHRRIFIHIKIDSFVQDFSLSLEFLLTDKVTSLPLVLFSSDGDFEAHVALSQHKRLNANHSIAVHIPANDLFRVEAAGDAIVGLEARSRDVDDCTAQHVSGFRGKDQWQIGRVYM